MVLIQQTGGRFINTGSSVISNITGTQNTQLLASLASKEQVFLDRNALSESFGAQWNEVVSLYMADETGLKLLLVTFIADSSTFFNFSCFEGAEDLVNPVVESDGGGESEADGGVSGGDITDVIFTETRASLAMPILTLPLFRTSRVTWIFRGT